MKSKRGKKWSRLNENGQKPQNIKRRMVLGLGGKKKQRDEKKKFFFFFGAKKKKKKKKKTKDTWGKKREENLGRGNSNIFVCQLARMGSLCSEQLLCMSQCGGQKKKELSNLRERMHQMAVGVCSIPTQKSSNVRYNGFRVLLRGITGRRVLVSFCKWLLG